jgi:putative redox protein
MRIPIKNLEVDLEAINSEEVGTITEANFEIRVNADASEQKLQKMTRLTLENCPVGILFNKAGVKVDYTLIRNNE